MNVSLYIVEYIHRGAGRGGKNLIIAEAILAESIATVKKMADRKCNANGWELNAKSSGGVILVGSGLAHVWWRNFGRMPLHTVRVKALLEGNFFEYLPPEAKQFWENQEKMKHGNIKVDKAMGGSQSQQAR